jgi:apolipoprotein N-acyltransferase
MSNAVAANPRVWHPAELAGRLASIAGWRRFALAFFSGAAATLALPPVYFLPVLYVAFPVLVWMLAGASSRRAAFALGWWFGFGWFVTSLYWIGNALLIFGDRHAWMIPFAVLGLPAFLAVYTGLAGLVATLGRNHLERALWLTVGWVAAEWVRGHAFTGFPWNLAGYSWMGADALMQPAALLGAYGLSLAAVASASLPAALATPRRRLRFTAVAAAALIPALAFAFGTWRLASAPAGGGPGESGIGMRIVQAGIPQREKWRRDLRERNFRTNLSLSVANRPDWVTHVIWPENAATFFIEDEAAYRQAMARVLPPGGLLITGAPRRSAPPLRLWNSVFAVDSRGDIVGRYDKSHLVPFGEYVPLREYLPIDKVTQGAVDYSAGPGPQTIHLPGISPVSPLVCYEAIFPGAVVDGTDRPAWILNLTNDAWYGISAGPHQHLAISRLRAVEEGMPIVRAANTGISAVADSFGRDRGRIGLDRQGILDFRLPNALAHPTLYALYGDWIVGGILALFAAGLFVLRAYSGCSGSPIHKPPRP